MPELAEILRVAGLAYAQAHAERMLPSHHRAMRDIVACRTPALGGSLYRCDDCGALDYAYHSCRNRHCPKCQADRAQQWLERLRARLLPCDHYLLTFTLPHQLRAVARAHQTMVYAALLREAAAAVQTLADDPTWVGGTLGILAVLHTLSQIFRAKMHGALRRAGVDGTVDPTVWTRAWTVHIQQIGSGEHATRYLARYVYHVALTNHRLERFAHGRVTFRYTHARTQETRRLTLPVDTFIGRFLQHVLPRGLTKVRYYGLLSPTGRTDLERARHLLNVHATPHVGVSAADGAATPHVADRTRVDAADDHVDTASAVITRMGARLVALPTRRGCGVCGRGQRQLIQRWQRSRAPPC